MQTSRRRAGIALLVFTLGTFAALTMTQLPAGNYRLSQIHGYVAPGARAPIFAGAVIGVLAALALLYYLSALRDGMPPGRGRDLLWGSGIAAAATAAAGWMIAAAIPVAYAQAAGTSASPRRWCTPSASCRWGWCTARPCCSPASP
jgi:hypothetical protein